MGRARLQPVEWEEGPGRPREPQLWGSVPAAPAAPLYWIQAACVPGDTRESKFNTGKGKVQPRHQHSLGDDWLESSFGEQDL